MIERSKCQISILSSVKIYAPPVRRYLHSKKERPKFTLIIEFEIFEQ